MCWLVALSCIASQQPSHTRGSMPWSGVERSGAELERSWSGVERSGADEAEKGVETATTTAFVKFFIKIRTWFIVAQCIVLNIIVRYV